MIFQKEIFSFMSMDKMNQFLLVLFCLVFILFPFKLFKPGDLQLSNYLTVLFCIFGSILYYKELVRIFSERAFLFLGLFGVWTIIVNIFYSTKYVNVEFLIDGAMYFTYFLFSAILVIVLRKYNRIYSNVFLFFSILLIIPICIYVLFISDISLIPKATFNNKNQLSQWCLFISVYIIYFTNKIKLNISSQIGIAFILSILTSLIIISITRAATGAVFILLFIAFFRLPKLIALTVLLTLLILIVHYSLDEKSTNKTISTFEHKYIEKKNKYDTFSGRGYWRISQYPKYLLLGAGEKLHSERFNDRYGIHSSYGNILFSYGIIGFSFLIISYFYFFTTLRWEILLILPFFFISLFHNTLRIPFIWMFPIFYFVDSMNKKVV